MKKRNLFPILILGVCLGIYSAFSNDAANPVMPAHEEFTFNPYEIVTDVAKHQTVLPGFLLEGPIAKLIVVSVDENSDRHLRIYAFDNETWGSILDIPLRPEVLFVDVANIDGRDRLVTYEQGNLNWFDPEPSTKHPLVAVTSNFNPPHKNEIPHVDITHDVNGDDRDDLVVPDTDGFWVFIQRNDGTFAEKVKIGPPTEMERIRGADGYRYNPWSQSRVHEVDYNRDSRTDLVFWNKDHFKVHLQDEYGLFSSKAKTFTTDVAFDSDRLSLLTTGDMTGKVLHSLADLNGDGFTDLVVFKLSGDDISSKRSSYEVHFGMATPDGGTVFSLNPDTVFQSDKKIQIGMHQHDFNGDGKVELIITTIHLKFLKGSLWKRIKGFMGDDVWLDIEFYQMEEGSYPETPNATRRIALDGVPSHREPGWVPLDIVLRGGKHEKRNAQKSYPLAFNPTIRIGDVTGDGRSDLLLADHPRIMTVFSGVPGLEMFVQQPQAIAVNPPNDEEYTYLVDLNKDRVLDLLMHHPFTRRDAHGAPTQPPGTEPHRLKILIAR